MISKQASRQAGPARGCMGWNSAVCLCSTLWVTTPDAETPYDGRLGRVGLVPQLQMDGRICHDRDDSSSQRHQGSLHSRLISSLHLGMFLTASRGQGRMSVVDVDVDLALALALHHAMDNPDSSRHPPCPPLAPTLDAYTRPRPPATPTRASTSSVRRYTLLGDA